MKKAIVLSILGITASGISAFGQGAINFGNYSSASYEPVYYNPTASSAPAGLAGKNANTPTTEVQLFYAIGNLTGDSTSAFLAAATAGVTTFITTSYNGAGSYMGLPATSTGGVGGYFSPVEQIIAGWSSGPVTFLAQAWETAGPNGGATYAASHLSGESALWMETDVVSTTGAPPPTPAFANNPAIELSLSVPEPTTMALGGLGLAALMFFRRKNV